MVPNYIRKIISGWSNYSCMVISHKMNENEMGYRGSKSAHKAVKEQRVDGSWFLARKARSLRYTLMGFERNYQVKIPSKQLNKLYYSTVRAITTNINPNFVSGFTDAEGCFGISIYKNKKLNTGWRVTPFFSIALNKRDLSLLNQLQEFFGGVGTIRSDQESDALRYSVYNLKDLTNIIIPHFNKYPLLTQKAADFNLFVQIIELMNKGAHTTVEGLQKIINIKASLNLGLSDAQKSEFNQVKPVERKIIQTTNIPDPNWVSGFVSGEGNFDAVIRTTSKGYKVSLRFRVSQHQRDSQLIGLIISYLGVGRLEKNRSAVTLVIGNFSDLNKLIIPFFNQYPILGIKHLDYLDWCKISNLIASGSHKTNEGIEEIRKIKSGMNTGRK
uniref:hypothetical protein n=1 Tax=Perenniporia fraxinea TaxID=1350006 RepID=UPI0028E0A209|nr:hypothetical protein QLP32_mgp32 [Perenniporia fraxinea]WFS78691.1 hypothetical protein [Perenniporia fraxinea]